MAHTDNLLSRISVNPSEMVGKPTSRGLRIAVEQILRALAAGITEEELMDEYPELQKEDFQAVVAYATGLVESMIPPVREISTAAAEGGTAAEAGSLSLFTQRS